MPVITASLGQELHLTTWQREAFGSIPGGFWLPERVTWNAELQKVVEGYPVGYPGMNVEAAAVAPMDTVTARMLTACGERTPEALAVLRALGFRGDEQFVHIATICTADPADDPTEP